MDIKQKIGRAMELVGPALEAGEDPRSSKQQDADSAELMMIGIEVLGGVAIDINRLANAAENLNESLRSLATQHGAG